MLKRIALLALPLVLLSACSKDAVDDTEPAGPSDEELAADLWAAMDGYESWATPSNWPEYSASADGTHGDYVSIYINDVEEAGGGDGAIIVKVGYDEPDGGSPKAIAVMWQTADFESDSGWFWARYNMEGEATLMGNPDACTGCHSAASDYQTYKTNDPAAEE